MGKVSPFRDFFQMCAPEYGKIGVFLVNFLQNQTGLAVPQSKYKMLALAV